MSNMGNELSRKLQPAQGATAVVCVGAISAIAILYPDEVGNRIPHLTSFIHLASISAWFGIHFWVTFVAGLTKMKLLPRHLFGLVQSHLFPKAFLYGICLTSVATATFVIQNPYSTWQFSEKMQVLALLINLQSTLANYIIVDPRMEGYMQQMHKFEKEHGHGQEVGPITDPALLGNSQYKEIRKNFFVYHGISTTLNLLGFVSTGVYLWFLSKKIKF